MWCPVCISGDHGHAWISVCVKIIPREVNDVLKTEASSSFFREITSDSECLHEFAVQMDAVAMDKRSRLLTQERPCPLPLAVIRHTFTAMAVRNTSVHSYKNLGATTNIELHINIAPSLP